MRALLSRLETVDTRLLVLAAVLLCGVVFAAVKAAGAFGEHDAPAYRNHPAKAFVPPASATLIEPRFVSKSRLPDEDYEQVLRAGRPLLNAVGRLNVSDEQLLGAGMSAADAKATVAVIAGRRSELAGRDVLVSSDVTVVPSADQQSVALSVEANYSSSTGGLPPVAGSAVVEFERAPRGGWRAAAANLNVTNEAAFDSTSPYEQR